MIHRPSADKSQQHAFPLFSPVPLLQILFIRFLNHLLISKWCFTDMQCNHQPSFTVMSGKKHLAFVMERPVCQPFSINPAHFSFEPDSIGFSVSDNFCL